MSSRANGSLWAGINDAGILQVLHSLVESRGSLQRVSDVGRKVSGILSAAPQLLLPFGMKHVPDVIQSPGLPDLQKHAQNISHCAVKL